MRWPTARHLVPLMFLLAWLETSTGSRADGAQAAEVKPRTGITVWDTGKPSAEALAPAALASAKDWTAIPLDKTADSFQGDAVLSNGRLLAVLRQRDAALEVHTLRPDGVVARLRLRLLTIAGEPAARLERVALVENTRGAACLEGFFRTAQGTNLSARFRLKRGEVAVQTEPGSGAGRLRVECPGRFVVLPDFFADDILIDATRLPLSIAEVPSENFVLHLTGQGDAIAMCVFENRQQEIKVTLAGRDDQRLITGSEIGFEGRRVWVALLEAPQIWHARELQASDAERVLPLTWQRPFAAQWRVDFTRTKDLTESWDMLLQPSKGADYVKPAWFGGPAERVSASTRQRFTEVLGFFPYPCWTDHEGRGYVQPLEVTTRTKFVTVLKHQGPMVLYPFNRLAETPPETYTMVDVARNALGVGPCQYILDLEGQKQEYKGVATCPTQDALLAIYAKGQQKQQRAAIEKSLQDALVFVTHIRSRISLYVAFGHKVRQYLAEQKKAFPQLRDQITELETIAAEMDARFAEREERIQTPAHVARMNEDFRKNVLEEEGPDALARCQQYTEALVRIGGNQDKLVSEGRWVARTLRQRAGLLMALDPRLAPIAVEIRARAQEVLRNPSNHERARQ